MSKMTIGSKVWLSLITSGAEDMDISVSAEQARQLAVHCDLLVQWNRKINLTAIIDPYDVAVKHVLDAIAPTMLIPDNAKILDMGAGGGFPGIPLKILNPSLFLTLVDSVTKKISFIKHVIRTLKLKDCTAISGRVEDLGKVADHAGKYGIVVSRSFAPLSRIIPWAVPFLAPGGTIIALKGKGVDEELKEFELNVRQNKTDLEFNSDRFTMEIKYYNLPKTDMKRALVALHRQ